jgi:type IV fimbrial biogenesis protein FimT
MLDALNPRHHKAMSQGKAISPSVKMKIRGLTLMEVMVTVAIMAILLVLAVPSFNSFLARGRLTGAAEGLALDLQLAKSEAIRGDTPVRLTFSSGNAWCYGSVPTNSSCTCAPTNTCTLRQVDSSSYAGVTMSAVSFPSSTPNDFTTFTAGQGVANAGTVEFTHPNAGTLRVSLGAAGQVSICSTLGGLGHHPAC